MPMYGVHIVPPNVNQRGSDAGSRSTSQNQNEGMLLPTNETVGHVVTVNSTHSSNNKTTQLVLVIIGLIIFLPSCLYFSKFKNIENQTLTPLAGIGMAIGLALILIATNPRAFTRAASSLCGSKPANATFFFGNGVGYTSQVEGTTV